MNKKQKLLTFLLISSATFSMESLERNSELDIQPQQEQEFLNHQFDDLSFFNTKDNKEMANVLKTAAFYKKNSFLRYLRNLKDEKYINMSNDIEKTLYANSDDLVVKAFMGGNECNQEEKKAKYKEFIDLFNNFAQTDESLKLQRRPLLNMTKLSLEKK